jgi:trehalose 6-phosphate phosphatase
VRMSPKYLFDEWPKVEFLVSTSVAVCLMLDFDGTLTPIVERPEMAALPLRTRGLLSILSGKERCSVAIISGRALKDLRRLVDLRNVYYAGNHGLEIEGPHLKFVHPMAKDMAKSIRKISKFLRNNLCEVEGVLIEDKGLTLSVHYRLVPQKEIIRVKNLVGDEVGKWQNLKLTKGKKVLEVRPVMDWNKGKAVEFILKRVEQGSLPVFIGDDETDQDAFRKIRSGLSIAVMNEPTQTHASYYLRNTLEVQSLLERINDLT